MNYAPYKLAIAALQHRNCVHATIEAAVKMASTVPHAVELNRLIKRQDHKGVVALCNKSAYLTKL